MSVLIVTEAEAVPHKGLETEIARKTGVGVRAGAEVAAENASVGRTRIKSEPGQGRGRMRDDETGRKAKTETQKTVE